MSELPDILIVTHRVPFPPDKGDRIRTYHLLKWLSGRARIHLAALADETVSPEATSALTRLCFRINVVPIDRFQRVRGLRSLVSGGTASEGAFRSKQMTQLLGEWAATTNFTACIASATSVAHYLTIPSLQNAIRVIDSVDMDSQKWLDYAEASGPPMTWVYGLEGRRLRQTEKQICGWADAVTLVSDHEAIQMRTLTQRENVYSIPNGVDLSYFRPTTTDTESGCVFVGALDYLPNVDGITWFARAVWPNVRQWRPDARLTIVGRNPSREVKELAAVPGVDLISQVPDVRPYLTAAAIAIAPLRIARGLQNKVLEAFASGKPIVASPAALAGFGNHPELPARAVSEPAEWVDVICQLLADPEARHWLGDTGRSYAERHHNWTQCLEPFGRLLGLPTGDLA